MNAINVSLGNWLGLPAPATESDLLGIVEEKLAPAVIKRLISLGSNERRSAAIVPRRTLQHRRFATGKAYCGGIGPGFAGDQGHCSDGICLRQPGTQSALAAHSSSATGRPHPHFAPQHGDGQPHRRSTSGADR